LHGAVRLAVLPRSPDEDDEDGCDRHGEEQDHHDDLGCELHASKSSEPALLGALERRVPSLAAPDERDVSLGVGDRGPTGHAMDRALPRTANGERLRTRLGRNDQLARVQVCSGQVRPGEDQQTVRPARRRARGSQVREVRGRMATKLRRHKAERLGPDVAAGGKSRLGYEADATEEAVMRLATHEGAA